MKEKIDTKKMFEDENIGGEYTSKASEPSLAKNWEKEPKLSQKELDEIIELFCDVDKKDIWGKDTVLFETDENKTALEKAREAILQVLK